MMEVLIDVELVLLDGVDSLVELLYFIYCFCNRVFNRCFDYCGLLFK